MDGSDDDSQVHLKLFKAYLSQIKHERVDNAAKEEIGAKCAYYLDALMTKVRIYLSSFND